MSQRLPNARSATIPITVRLLIMTPIVSAIYALLHLIVYCRSYPDAGIIDVRTPFELTVGIEVYL